MKLKNARYAHCCRCVPLPFKEKRLRIPIRSMRTLQSLSRILIHPLNKKLPVCREDAKLFLMNLRMTDGAVLRRDEQTSGVVLLIIGRKIKARQKRTRGKAGSSLQPRKVLKTWVVQTDNPEKGVENQKYI